RMTSQGSPDRIQRRRLPDSIRAFLKGKGNMPVPDPSRPMTQPASLPLLATTDTTRSVAWRHGKAVSAGEFLAHVNQVARQLPPGRHVINLCEDRYAFLVAFCAALVRGQTNLLPPSRAPQAVADILAAHP